jgi:hypothetical protein
LACILQSLGSIPTLAYDVKTEGSTQKDKNEEYSEVIFKSVTL